MLGVDMIGYGWDGIGFGLELRLLGGMTGVTV